MMFLKGRSGTKHGQGTFPDGAKNLCWLGICQRIPMDSHGLPEENISPSCSHPGSASLFAWRKRSLQRCAWPSAGESSTRDIWLNPSDMICWSWGCVYDDLLFGTFIRTVKNMMNGLSIVYHAQIYWFRTSGSPFKLPYKVGYSFHFWGNPYPLCRSFQTLSQAVTLGRSDPSNGA